MAGQPGTASSTSPFFIFNGPLKFSWIHERQVVSGQRRYTVFGKEDRHNFFHYSTSHFSLNKASHSHNLKYYPFTGDPPNYISLDFSDLQTHHLGLNHRCLKLNKSKTKLSASSLNLPQSPLSQLKITPIFPDMQAKH